MIGSLRGTVVERSVPGKIVLDVHHVGYEVEVSLPTFFQLSLDQSDVCLSIQTIVREDAFLLYGFLRSMERTLFRALIKVNGVGPKMAMAVLSTMSPEDFVYAIESNQVSVLTKIPGVGKKMAERLLVEMKDLRSQLTWDVPMIETVRPTTVEDARQQDAIIALEALGYKKQEAIKMIRQCDDGQITTEGLIRQALQSIHLRT